MKSPFLPSDWPRLIRELEADLGDILYAEMKAAGCERLYIVRASEVSSPVHARLLGVASQRACYAFRGMIGDRWRGPGPCVLLNDAAIDSGGRDWHEAVIPIAASVICHEAAHAVEMGLPSELTAQTTPWDAAFLAALAKCPNGRSDIVDSSNGGPPWQLHGIAFIRLALHIAERLRAEGWPIFTGRVFSGELYGLSSEVNYFLAFSPELKSLSGLTLSDIAAHPLPEAAQRLWEADVVRWVQKQQPERPVARSRGKKSPATKSRKQGKIAC